MLAMLQLGLVLLTFRWSRHPALYESDSHKIQDFGSILFKKTPPESKTYFIRLNKFNL
ncbi:hypothetical protein [Clostridium sp.]|uniref:hypothetical protein n=1 Tax=Clostridium sp. TaxID=1506 RepID=UPI001D83AA04|nr:hypothetical protein [Clostridium sp.]MBS5938656.1 hypothetical protein [Clostridium sp.]